VVFLLFLLATSALATPGGVANINEPSLQSGSWIVCVIGAGEAIQPQHRGDKAKTKEEIFTFGSQSFANVEPGMAMNSKSPFAKDCSHHFLPFLYIGLNKSGAC
jgi:hypothetical protein